MIDEHQLVSHAALWGNVFHDFLNLYFFPLSKDYCGNARLPMGALERVPNSFLVNGNYP